MSKLVYKTLKGVIFSNNLNFITMPGTFSQIYIQIVFAVKGRENLISNGWKTELHKYIAGIVKGKEQKPIIVNGMPDHIYMLLLDYVLPWRSLIW